MMGPHNWAIMYRLNYNTRRMFKRWQTLQIAYARSGSDQVSGERREGMKMSQNRNKLSEDVWK